MERLEYRAAIKNLSERYGQPSTSDQVEVQIITDVERDHYQLVHVGWQNKRRVYGCVLHIDIKNDKIWIQHDGTEIGMANELVAAGIPKENIVLGFQSPYKRQFTEFATG
jgi:hypothetical protein